MTAFETLCFDSYPETARAMHLQTKGVFTITEIDVDTNKSTINSFYVRGKLDVPNINGIIVSSEAEGFVQVKQPILCQPKQYTLEEILHDVTHACWVFETIKPCKSSLNKKREVASFSTEHNYYTCPKIKEKETLICLKQKKYWISS